jgi:transcriptional regulator with XRE-family HTH domain
VAGKQAYHFDIRASFAIAFKNWREKNQITLKKIATDLGVGIATVQAWEGGERFPSGDNLELLASYTGVPPCRLFCVMADKCVPADCILAHPTKPKSRRKR